MKSTISRLVQAFLALAALCLLASLFIPWRTSASLRAQCHVPNELPGGPAGVPRRLDRASPAEISSLFLAKAITKPFLSHSPSQTIAPGTKEPVDAPWLSYLGYCSRSPGTLSCILKDNRSGRVRVVESGAATATWSVVEVTDARVIVRNGDDYYVVRKRQP